MPLINDGKFIQFCSLNWTGFGSIQSPGLPEITGGFDLAQGAVTRYDSKTSGCFSKGTSTSFAPNFVGESGWADLYFDASRSSSIYGNSTTVQPYSIYVTCFIKY